MKPFAYSRSRNIYDALAKAEAGHQPLAGGTDLLPLLKTDIVSVSDIVDIKYAELPHSIEQTAEGVSIGALTTIAEIAANPLLNNDYPLLAQAAQETGSLQIRNRATLGGNLLQRPRCWYFRNPRAHCWLKGGEECLAVEGHNEHHAIFDESPCKAVHPSDLAGCLLALDAKVTLRSPIGDRSASLHDFFVPPAEGRRTETSIAANELLTSVSFPSLAAGSRSIYLKAMSRKTWAFALVGVAVVVHKPAETIEAVRIVANGVANGPRRLKQSERLLLGSRGEDNAIRAAAEAALIGTELLSENAYKVDLLRRLVKKALRQMLL